MKITINNETVEAWEVKEAINMIEDMKSVVDKDSMLFGARAAVAQYEDEQFTFLNSFIPTSAEVTKDQYKLCIWIEGIAVGFDVMYKVSYNFSTYLTG